MVGKKKNHHNHCSQLSQLFENYVVVLSCSVVSTLCGPMDWSPPGSSAHGILQARALEWVDISLSRASSWPTDGNRVSWASRIGGGFFINSAAWEALENYVNTE